MENTDPKIIELDLSVWYPKNIVYLDIRPFLFHDIAVKEKDFKKAIAQELKKDIYQDAIINIICSVECILPAWVTPFLCNKFSQSASFVSYTNSKTDFLKNYYGHLLNSHSWDQYQGKRVLLRGCSDKEIPNEAYQLTAFHLGKVVKKLSYGELCSQIPL
jgi:hypothetical protein